MITIRDNFSPAHRHARGAFTMMELMVSIGILVIIILSVNVVFSGASRSVSMSQATMEMTANVRATQGSIERDLESIDRTGFLVIRSRLQNPNGNPVPNMPNTTYADISPRYDQISFLARGNFQNVTGADTNNPYTDSTTATAAHIWIGQMIVEKQGADPNPSNGPKYSYVAPDQSAVYGPTTPPTGAFWNGSALQVTKESDFVLGRHRTLLVAGPADNNAHVYPAGQNVLAYPTLDGTLSPGTLKGTVTENNWPAHITSSRFAVCAQTPTQVMQEIVSRHTTGEAFTALPELNYYCYRFRTLSSVYDTEVEQNPFVNGYFRTTPRLMGGVSSFKVEWTDGNTYDNTDTQGRFGQLKWYGPTNPSGLAYGGQPVDQMNASGFANGDHYIAVFSYYNKPMWPKAIRITMHVASDRLGGRDFVQVVNLPQ